jgi:phosphoglycolate phosphatase-like HAD superfamily hydrolase
MTAFPPELVVLDIAGTTVDDGQQVYRVLGETAKAHGATPTEADIARWHGSAKHEALRALLTARDGTPPSAEALETVIADFRSRLATAYADNPPRPLPGVPEALGALRATARRPAPRRWRR